MRRKAKLRSGRRRRQAGAILVEALIVAGTIMVALQCTWALYQFCLHQHRAQLEARAAAWETALRGCGESQLGGVLSALSKSSDGKNVGGMLETGDSPPGWVQVRRAKDGAVSLDLPAVILGRSHVEARQQFACNEQGNRRPLQLIGAGDATGAALDTSAEQPAP